MGALVTVAARWRGSGPSRVPVLGSVAVPARWLSVLLSLLGGCPFCLWCCGRVAPVALSAFPCRWPHLVGASFGVGGRLDSAVCLWCCRSMAVPSVSCLGKWLPLSPFFLGSSPLLFFFPLKPPIILLSLYFLTPSSSIYILYIIIYKNNIIIFNSRF